MIDLRERIDELSWFNPELAETVERQRTLIEGLARRCKTLQQVMESLLEDPDDSVNKTIARRELALGRQPYETERTFE